MTEPKPPTPRRPRKKVSEKQMAANRRNAQKSTGPSPEGKSRSARNATKAGIWARELIPISAGPFEEDPGEFWRRAEEIIKGLGPRDALELELAAVMAAALSRIRRTGPLEAALLTASVEVDPAFGSIQFADRRLYLDPTQLEADLMDVALLRDHVGIIAGREATKSDSLPWAVMGRLLNDVGPNGPDVTRDVISHGQMPETEDEWKEFSQTLFSQMWPDEASCEEYLTDKQVQLALSLPSVLVRHHAQLAQAQLEITGQTDRARGAAITEFTRVHAMFVTLQERELDEPD